MSTAVLTVLQEFFLDVCIPVSLPDFHCPLLQACFSHEVSVILNAFRSRFSYVPKCSFGRPVGRESIG